MKQKVIRQLVTASYTDDALNEKNVLRIVKHLTREELRMYIKALKIQEKKRTVIVTVPQEKNMGDKKEIEHIFTGKRITYISDPSLLLGIRIQDNDTIYEGNLKSTLEDLVKYINQV